TVMKSVEAIGAIFDDANMSHANAEFAKLNGAQLNNTNLSNAKLGGADLSGATVDGLNLTNADIDATKLVQLKGKSGIVGLEQTRNTSRAISD
ncbi:MAG: pentapeptide repeat-containing protein, partial [Pseudomonadales bacterium]